MSQPVGERPVVNITGASVALGPLQREHLDTLHGWFNDFRIARTQGDLPGPRARERAGECAGHRARVDC